MLAQHNLSQFLMPRTSQYSLPSSEVSLDLADDPLLNLSVGLRYLFWKTGAFATSSRSCFRSVALESPQALIVQVLR